MSAVSDMLRKGDLFDFYGELLSDHQKRIYEAYVCEDLSLSEIAETEGIRAVPFFRPVYYTKNIYAIYIYANIILL